MLRDRCDRLWDAWPAHPLSLVVNLAVPPRQQELTRLRQQRTLAFWQQKTLMGDTAVETRAIKDELDAMLQRAFTAGDRLVWARVHVVAWGPPATVARADDAVLRRVHASHARDLAGDDVLRHVEDCLDELDRIRDENEPA